MISGLVDSAPPKEAHQFTNEWQIRRNIPKEEVTGNKDDRSTAMFTVEDVHVGQWPCIP